MFKAGAIVHLGLMRVDSLAASQALESWSTEEDRRSRPRPASHLARALLRGMLAEITQSPAEMWGFSRQALGQPAAFHQGGDAAPAISLSHSGSWVAYAATFAGAIGIDIEQSRDGRDYAGIAERAFGPRECDAVSRFGPARFYAIWTLREAIAKAAGMGLQMAADGRDRVPDGPYDSSQWVGLEDAAWWLMHRQPSPEINLALAFRPSDGQSQEVHLHWWPEEA